MPAQRYFHSALLSVGGIIHLAETEQKHLIQVMRTRPGEIVEIVNGQGQLAKAVLQSIEKSRSPLLIEEVETKQPTNFHLILAQALPRPNRLDFIIEKATELGVNEFWLFPSELSEKTEVSKNLLSRLEMITISAMKQCGRLYLPQIKVFPNINRWNIPSFPILFGDTQETAPLIEKGDFQNGVVWVIGPEKGLSLQEIEKLNSIGAKGIKLHHNILRTDTASLVALSLTEYLLNKKSD